MTIKFPEVLQIDIKKHHFEEAFKATNSPDKNGFLTEVCVVAQAAREAVDRSIAFPEGSTVKVTVGHLTLVLDVTLCDGQHLTELYNIPDRITQEVILPFDRVSSDSSKGLESLSVKDYVFLATSLGSGQNVNQLDESVEKVAGWAEDFLAQAMLTGESVH